MNEHAAHPLVIETRGQIEALRAHAPGMGPGELTVRAVAEHEESPEVAGATSGTRASAENGHIVATLTFVTGRPAELSVPTEPLPDALELDYESTTRTTVSNRTLTTRTHIVLRHRSEAVDDHD